MICPNCSEEAPEEAKFCEACGQDLNIEPSPMCVSCGEREVGDEGYCLSCGYKQPEERDHMEFRAGSTVAVTDRGKRHRHNEDAVALGQTNAGDAVLVVCDGVSSTPGSAEASKRAAATACDLLLSGLDDSVVDVDTLLAKAVEAAQAEASASTELEADGRPVTYDDDAGGPPSSTFVAVVVRSVDSVTTELSTAWVGDSRAYWVGDIAAAGVDADAGALRLSPVDHELNGSLVRWLGADSVDPTPDVTTTQVEGPGWVVVCSDGLWRYAAEPAEMQGLLGRLANEGERGLGMAKALVDFANEQGGHDNISVVLWSNHPERLDADGELSGGDAATSIASAVAFTDEGDPAPPAMPSQSDES